MARTPLTLEPVSIPANLPFAVYQLASSIAEITAALQVGESQMLVIGLEGAMPDTVAESVRVVPGRVSFDLSRQMELQPLPYDDNAFSCAVAADILDQLPEAAREFFIREMARVASRYVLLASPFDSAVTVSAEESLDEIHRTVHGAGHPRVLKHRECGLPHLVATCSSLESATGYQPEVLPNTSLRSWALFEMLGCVAGMFPRGDLLFSRLSAFYNERLGRLDHCPPAYYHILLAPKGNKPVKATVARSLAQRFGPVRAEAEIQTVRELMRLVLDSYAEALNNAPAASPLTQAVDRVRELETTVREQTHTIQRLTDELYILKNSRNSKSAGNVIKKLFTI
jgi:hypothetical protein